MTPIFCRLLVLAVLLAALVGRRPGLTALSIVLALATAVSWLYQRYALSNVSYERQFIPDRVGFGEETSLVLSRSPMPRCYQFPGSWCAIASRSA